MDTAQIHRFFRKPPVSALAGGLAVLVWVAAPAGSQVPMPMLDAAHLAQAAQLAPAVAADPRPGGLVGSHAEEVLQRLALSQGRTPFSGRRVVRLHREGKPKLVLREDVFFQPASGGEPDRFRLDLVGVEGSALAPEELARRRQAYLSHSAFLFHHRDFRVRDWKLAATTYSVQTSVARGGGRPRDLHRIFPRVAGRSGFEVEVDRATGFIVRTREFDASSRLVMEMEFETLRLGEQASLPQDRTPWHWTPMRPVAVHPEVEAAVAAVAAEFDPRIPKPGDPPAGYTLSEIRTTLEPVSGRRFLVLEYTDGIDTLFLLQARTTALGAVGGEAEGAGGAAREVKVYRHVDAGHSQCWTAYKGITFIVVSRVTDDQVPSMLLSLLDR